MNRKFILIGAGALLVIVALFSLLSAGKVLSTDINIDDDVNVPYALGNSAASYGQDSVVFSNGRSLSSYNYVSGTSTTLTPIRPGHELGSIDSIAPSSDLQHILFHTNMVASGGILSDKLASLGLDQSADYWWVYGVKEQAFTPLPAGTTIAKIKDAHVYGLSGIAPDQKISTYGVSDLKKTFELPIIHASNFFPLDQGYILQTPDNAIVKTDDGNISRQLVESAKAIGISPDGLSVIAEQVINPSEKSAATNLISVQIALPHDIQTIADDLKTQSVISPGGAVVFGVDTSIKTKLLSHDAATSTTAQWVLPNNSAGDTSQYVPQTAINNQTAIVTADNINMQLLGTNIFDLQPTNTNYQEIIEINGTPVTINYDDRMKGFVVYPRLSNTTDELAAVNQKLKNDGYKPDLYQIILVDVTD